MWKRVCLCLLLLLCIMSTVAMAEGELAQASYRDFEGAWEITSAMDDEGNALELSEYSLNGVLVLRDSSDALLYQQGNLSVGRWNQLSGTSEAMIILGGKEVFQLQLTEDGARINLVGGQIMLHRREYPFELQTVDVPSGIVSAGSQFAESIETRRRVAEPFLEPNDPQLDEANLRLDMDGSFLLGSTALDLLRSRLPDYVREGDVTGTWVYQGDTLILQFDSSWANRRQECYVCSLEIEDDRAILKDVQYFNGGVPSLINVGIWADAHEEGNHLVYSWLYALKLNGSAIFQDASGASQEGYTWVSGGSSVRIMDAAGTVVEQFTDRGYYSAVLSKSYEAFERTGNSTTSVVGEWDGYLNRATVKITLNENGSASFLAVIPFDDMGYEQQDGYGEWTLTDEGVRIYLNTGTINLPYVGGHLIYTMSDGSKLPLVNDEVPLPDGDYTYALLEDGTIQLTAYKGTATQIEIPSEIDGYQVSSIGRELFKDREDLTTVTIPVGVTEIRDGAFRYCRNLTSISLPEGLIRIEMDAFSGCSKLMSIVLPSTATKLGARIFENCTSLASVTLPQSLLIIPERAFYGCWALTSIELPEGLQMISYNAFAYTNLKEAVLPSSLVSLKNGAFSYCRDLEKVEMRNELTEICKNTFKGCSVLKDVFIPASVATMEKDIFEECYYVVLHVARNSAAEDYAREYGLQYVYTDGTMAELTGNNNAGKGQSEADWPDDEAALRQRLGAQLGGATFDIFFYDDYDGDGSFEAFALAGGGDEYDGYSGDLWFVSGKNVTMLIENASFLSLAAEGDASFKLFTAEEWYGGSGSWSRVWYVHDGAPKRLDVDSLGGFSYDGGNQFSSYSDAFDNYSDGTGHTWKRYYYYFDPVSEQIKEYGGLAISQKELLAWPGAQEILRLATGKGWQIGEIYYRANGVINVNLYESGGGYASMNENLTLRIEGDRVVDTGESYTYGGTYQWANTPQLAEVPAAFVLPQGVYPAPTSLPIDTSGKKELMDYLNTDFFEFVKQMGLSDIGTSEGRSYSNGLISATTFSDVVEIINIEKDSNYMLSGIYYGMAMQNAQEQLSSTGWFPNVGSAAKSEYYVEYLNSYGDMIRLYKDGSAVGTIVMFLSEDRIDHSTDSGYVPDSYAYASARATGDVNMRSGPNLYDASITVIPSGSSVEYLGDSAVDERGVAWYHIRYSGMEGWGSSKYIVLQ